MFVLSRIVDGSPRIPADGPSVHLVGADHVFSKVRPNQVPEKFKDIAEVPSKSYCYILLPRYSCYFLANIIRVCDSKDVLKKEMEVHCKEESSVECLVGDPRVVEMAHVQPSIDSQSVKSSKPGTGYSSNPISLRSDNSLLNSGMPMPQVPSSSIGSMSMQQVPSSSIDSSLQEGTPSQSLPLGPSNGSLSPSSGPLINLQGSNLPWTSATPSYNSLQAEGPINLQQTLQHVQRSFSTLHSKSEALIRRIESAASNFDSGVSDLKAITDDVAAVRELLKSHAECGDLFKVSHIPDENNMIHVLPKGDYKISSEKYQALLSGRSTSERVRKSIKAIVDENKVTFDETGEVLVATACLNILKDLHRKAMVGLESENSFMVTHKIVQQNLRDHNPARKAAKAQKRKDRAASKPVISRKPTRCAMRSGSAPKDPNDTIEASTSASASQSVSPTVGQDGTSNFERSGNGNSRKLCHAAAASTSSLGENSTVNSTADVENAGQGAMTSSPMETFTGGLKRAGRGAWDRPPNKRLSLNNLASKENDVEANIVQRIRNGLRSALKPLPNLEAELVDYLPSGFKDLDTDPLIDNFASTEIGNAILTSVQSDNN